MTRVAVRPELLRWARERARRDERDLAGRFPKIDAWEKGSVQPTLKQLETFARATHVPIGYLFLAEPPVEAVPIPDFRTIAGAPIARPSPDLLDTVYLCQQRQEWYREDARILGERSLGFVGSARTADDPAAAAHAIRDALGFDVEARRSLPTWTEALRWFIEQADRLGVLVMVSGVVGSNTSRKLDPKEFRGFALADDLAPLVFINGADSKAAQMFTLAHEMAHLWLGESALSDAQPSSLPTQAVERWCNQVAAELLVPAGVFTAVLDRRSPPAEEMQRLARHFKVSTLVVLRRMSDVGCLTGDDYWTAYNAELDRLADLTASHGGDFYRSLGARTSKRFARAVVVSTLEGRSSYTEAFRLLGLRKMSTFRDLGESLGIPV